MKTINSIIYYSIIAAAALICMAVAIFSDICNHVIKLFTWNKMK